MQATPHVATGWRWEMAAPGAALERQGFELATPGRGEALVRVAGCGVCHTDLGFLYEGVKPKAPLPLALGHEISGEVVEVGEDHRHLLGRAVIVPAVTPCGACETCLSGHGTICARQIMPGNDVHGGFASHVTVPARGLCVVDDAAALRGETIGPSGCTLAELSVVADAVATPYQAAQRAQVGSGDLAIVVGLGGVGGFAAQIAAALGACVVGFDVDPARLALLSRHGVELALDPRGGDARALRTQVRNFAAERGLPATRWKIFECSGSAAGQELAFGLLVPGAYLSIVGYTLEPVRLRLSNLMAFDAKAAGNWGCLPELYPGALALVLEGRIALAPFVESHPMDELPAVLEAVHARRVSKRPVMIPRGT